VTLFHSNRERTKKRVDEFHSATVKMNDSVQRRHGRKVEEMGDRMMPG
jgi:hypothetical protein